MLTLKVGILMYKDNAEIRDRSISAGSKLIADFRMPNADSNRKSKIANRKSRRGFLDAFTFVEILVALAIVSISLLALIKLHLLSINMTDTAQITTQAIFLAEEKIAETLAAGYPQKGTDSGTAEKGVLPLHWETEVTDLYLPQLHEADITGLRKILVDVSWRQGAGQKHLQVSTYVADRKLP